MIAHLGGVWRRLRTGNLTLNAAAVAYHAFLALVPLTFAFLAVAAAIGRDQEAVARIARALDPIAPQAVSDFITGLLVDADRRIDGAWWVAALSILVSLFLGSRAVVALQRALAVVVGRVEVRRPVSLRLVSMTLTIAGGLGLLLTGTLLVAGRSVFAFLAGWSGHPIVLDLWAWLRIPVATSGLFGFLLLIYRYGPPVPLPRSVLGAAVATVGVAVGSLGFGWYLGLAPGLGAAFGTLGAVAVALVWLYLGAIAILAGAIVATEG